MHPYSRGTTLTEYPLHNSFARAGLFFFGAAVTFLNLLLDVKDKNIEGAIQSIKYNIESLYRQNSFLLTGNRLTAVEKEQFTAFYSNNSDTILAKSIRFLCECLSKYYGKNVIILLDEYDTPSAGSIRKRLLE